MCVLFVLQTALHPAAGGQVDAVRVLALATKKITQHPPKSLSIARTPFSTVRILVILVPQTALRGEVFSLCGHAWWYACRVACGVVHVWCLCV